jgi:alkanesulfonate monooxygenase SsuD/methylene tetrahydromethanopterin reductase-like flavin-dependent oxidoreductase (luciferase family)
MVPLSVLDLSPVPEGSDAGQALRNSLDLARHAEALGYKRYWMAEHHNMPGIASAATAVALAHVAAGTRTIRVGAGGVMLPNHSPLVIAEQFGTSAALHPGRIDLGLGRAPGSDMITARAMRRDLWRTRTTSRATWWSCWLLPARRARPSGAGGAGRRPRRAGVDTRVEHLRRAARRHARPALRLRLALRAGADDGAVAIYREMFRPSERLSAPYVMLGVNVFAADTDAEARRLFTSLQQAFLNLRTGRPGKLPPPVDEADPRLTTPAPARCSTTRSPAPSSAGRRRCGAGWRSSCRAQAPTS